MRNILEHVRRRDFHAVKVGAQAIYRAETRSAAQAAFRRFRTRWHRCYPAMVGRLERDLARAAELFQFLASPVAQLAHHQHHRALLRRSTTTHTTHGLLCQCAKRGSHCLFDL